MKEYRVSIKRDGTGNHVRHRIFAKEETALRWKKFYETHMEGNYRGLDGDWDHYGPVEPIIWGPRLQSREVGEWEDA